MHLTAGRLLVSNNYVLEDDLFVHASMYMHHRQEDSQRERETKKGKERGREWIDRWMFA